MLKIFFYKWKSVWICKQKKEENLYFPFWLRHIKSKFMWRRISFLAFCSMFLLFQFEMIIVWFFFIISLILLSFSVLKYIVHICRSKFATKLSWCKCSPIITFMIKKYFSIWNENKIEFLVWQRHTKSKCMKRRIFFLADWIFSVRFF